MTDQYWRGLIYHLTALVIGLSVAGSSQAGPIETLPGRWTGWGQMTMEGGETESVKCIATYFSEQGGRALRHNLRCASSNYRIDAVAQLDVQGGEVSGQWEERTYSAGGAVSGHVVGDGIAVDVVGQSFKARLKVETSKCKQSMHIEPKGIGVARISVDLAKC